MSLGLIETAHDAAWVDANRERLTKLYPLRRLGTAADVAPTNELLRTLLKEHGAILDRSVSGVQRRITRCSVQRASEGGRRGTGVALHRPCHVSVIRESQIVGKSCQ